MQNLTKKDITRQKMSAKYNCSSRILVSFCILVQSRNLRPQISYHMFQYILRACANPGDGTKFLAHVLQRVPAMIDGIAYHAMTSRDNQQKL